MIFVEANTYMDHWLRPHHRCWLDLIDIGGLATEPPKKYWRSDYESSRLIMTHLHMWEGNAPTCPCRTSSSSGSFQILPMCRLALGPLTFTWNLQQISFRNAFIEHLSGAKNCKNMLCNIQSGLARNIGNYYLQYSSIFCHVFCHPIQYDFRHNGWPPGTPSSQSTVRTLPQAPGSKWGLWRPGFIAGTETEVQVARWRGYSDAVAHKIWVLVNMVLLKPILEAEGPDRWVHRPRGRDFWISLVVEFSHTNCWIPNLEQFEHTMKQVRFHTLFHTQVVGCVWHVCRVVIVVFDWIDLILFPLRWW